MTRTLSATLTAVVLLAACGGERREGSATRSDSAVTTATTPTDSAARADSTAGQAPAPAAGAPAESAPSAPKAAAPTSAGKPADTGAKRATASKTPAKKPPAAPVKQDTTKAAAPAAAPSQAAASDQPDQPLRDAYHQAPRDTVDEATYDGWKQFNLNCARCHGEDVMGTTIAPHLILSLKPDGPINTKELFMQTVCAGRPAKGMPAWCALGLDMGKIQDIYAYVKGRSDAKIGPGRPAVKSGG
jgi:mono/diheme cytochrome c family protein